MNVWNLWLQIIIIYSMTCATCAFKAELNFAAGMVMIAAEMTKLFVINEKYD